jgi:fumarate reductase subunit D
VRARRSSAEAAAWLLFSAGGMAAALLVPVLLLLFGVLVPLGVPAPGHDHLAAVLGHPLVRVALFVLCVLSLLHWAHRFRYILFDGLQLARLRTPVNVLCYAAAAAGSVWAAA